MMVRTRKPRLIAIVRGKVMGYVSKSKAAWHFRPSEGTSLVQPTNPQMTLKRLGEGIELAIGVTGVQFGEPPPLVKAARTKRPTRHPKLTQEEWSALQRKEARLFPRAGSMECRVGGTSRGARPLSGGLPGLGKRR